MKYPIFIDWDESVEMEFINNEEELVEFCTSHQLNPSELQYYYADPMYAWEGVYVNADELANWTRKFGRLLTSSSRSSWRLNDPSSTTRRTARLKFLRPGWKSGV